MREARSSRGRGGDGWQLLRQVAQEKCSYHRGLHRVPGGRGPLGQGEPTLTQAWGIQCKRDAEGWGGRGFTVSPFLTFVK